MRIWAIQTCFPQFILKIRKDENKTQKAVNKKNKKAVNEVSPSFERNEISLSFSVSPSRLLPIQQLCHTYTHTHARAHTSTHINIFINIYSYRESKSLSMWAYKTATFLFLSLYSHVDIHRSDYFGIKTDTNTHIHANTHVLQNLHSYRERIHIPTSEDDLLTEQKEPNPFLAIYRSTYIFRSIKKKKTIEQKRAYQIRRRLKTKERKKKGEKREREKGRAYRE